MISGLVYHLTGGFKTKYHTKDGEVYDVDWVGTHSFLLVVVCIMNFDLLSFSLARGVAST